MFIYAGGVGIEIALAGRIFRASLDYDKNELTIEEIANGTQWTERITGQIGDSKLRLGLLIAADLIEQMMVAEHW